MQNTFVTIEPRGCVTSCGNEANTINDHVTNCKLKNKALRECSESHHTQHKVEIHNTNSPLKTDHHNNILNCPIFRGMEEYNRTQCQDEVKMRKRTKEALDAGIAKFVRDDLWFVLQEAK